MKTKLLTLLLAVAASVGTMFAEKVKIGDLYYNLDATNQTAEVTSQNSSYPYWSTTITTANIPASVEYNSVAYTVTSIGNSAFRECTGLTSVTIPNSVTSIGNQAFQNCTGLTSVTIPNSVTSIGNEAFYNCSGLTSVTIPNSVTSIGNYAFCSCSGLTSVTIPNSVTSIGYSAFYGCTGLTSPVYNAHVFAFMPTSYSGAYTIPDGIESIAGGAFYKCTGLTSVTIPNSVTSIGDLAFYWCTGLTSVTIPNSVTSIGDYAFEYCSSLTSVTIPNSVTSIGDEAFAYCSSLTSVTIGNSVTSIGKYAFLNCSNLTSVTIPNSVTSIGVQAFQSCSSLTSITCEATTPPTCGDDAFYNVSKTIPVYVPAASVDDYKAANQWKDFGENIQAIPTQTKEMTPGIAHLTWDETNQQWSITAYDDGDNPKFVFVFAADGAKTSLPAALSVTNSTDDMYVFADTEDSKFECTIKDATVTITYDGTGYQYNSVSGQYYVNAKIKGEMSDAYGNKLIVKEPTDFIKVYVPSDVATGINKVQSDQVPSTKFLRNGQIFILRGDRTYTTDGRLVR